MTGAQTGYKARTMRAYDVPAGELAQDFDGFFKRVASREATHFASGLEKDGLVLDLGCGDGTIEIAYASDKRSRGYVWGASDE